jgi:hypothetical protein
VSPIDVRVERGVEFSERLEKLGPLALGVPVLRRFHEGLEFRQ